VAEGAGEAGFEAALGVEVDAPVVDMSGEVDADGADFGAGLAEGGGFDEFIGRSFGEGGSQDFADGTRINPGVAVAADASVDGTLVEAGSATDAGEGFFGGCPPQFAAPIVYEDDVKGATHASGVVGREGGKALAGGAAGEKGEEGLKGVQVGNQFVDACDGDMEGRQAGSEDGVGFIFHDHSGAGLGDEEVGPRHTKVGAEEIRPKAPACGFGEAPRIGFSLRDEAMLEKKPSDFLAGPMNGRSGDMAGRLAEELDDALTEVGVDDFNAMLFQVRADSALFHCEGFGFDETLNSCFFAELQNDLPCLGGILGLMDLGSPGFGGLPELFEAAPGILADSSFGLLTVVTEAFPLRNLCHRGPALGGRIEDSLSVRRNFFQVSHTLLDAAGEVFIHRASSRIWAGWRMGQPGYPWRLPR
jgi:hypothetical protein